MRRLALALAVALSTSACGTHPVGAPVVARTAVIHALSTASSITSVAKNEQAASTTVTLTMVIAGQTRSVVAVLDTHDQNVYATLTSLSVDNKAEAPNSAAFGSTRMAIEDATMAQDWVAQYTVDWVLNVLETASPPKPNGWTLRDASYMGGDSEGRLVGTLTRDGVKHALHVELTDLGGLKADSIRSIELDGKIIAKGQTAALADLKKDLDGVTIAKSQNQAQAVDPLAVRNIVALLRQSRWQR